MTLFVDKVDADSFGEKIDYCLLSDGDRMTHGGRRGEMLCGEQHFDDATLFLRAITVNFHLHDSSKF
jgi:hypothetical protein